ncbi:MFS transporter [Variovorax sp. dw_954]|uniref:MFS transporter n=1 Tax=Variovorax sp. dw_954 TaxID=2720078 RepID=UPI001BD3D907|nr:MFS transporter [Variovorax sp. dw_954]
MTTIPLPSPAVAGTGPTDDLDATYRKITWRLIPFLFILWVLAWIDRVNIGFVKLTMLDDLKWSDSIYGLGAGIFFLGYFFFEVPSNLLLQRIGARKTITRITMGWGVVCVLMMFVKTPAMFYFLRFLMGVFEAGFYPGIILYLTYWYPSERRAKAFGMFMSASGVAGVIGGPLAGTVMNSLNGVNGWAGWQWVFLVEGVPSIIAAFVTWFYLTDRPQQAKWLSPAQRQLIEDDLARDRASLGHREESLLASLKDGRLWLLILVFFCVIAANSSLTFFGPSVVKEVGFTDPATIGWIMALSYLFGAIGMVVNGLHSDYSKEARLHCAFAAALGAVGLLCTSLFIQVSPVLALVAQTVAIIGTMSAIPVFWQLPGRFLAGAAAAGGVALINSIANLAGFGAPAMLGFIKTQTGGLAPGLLIVAAVEVCAAILILLFVPRFVAKANGK